MRKAILLLLAAGAARADLAGFADTHAHWVVQVAHGGKVMQGRSWSDRGLAGAMAPCGHGLLNAEGAHPHGGFPGFEGWPRFTTLAHHQAHADWIRRAHGAGLRLAVMLVSNSETTPRLLGSDRPYDDRSVTEASIDELQRMIAHEDRLAGGPGKAWLQVATSPARARELIGQGKLAVVLGVEVDAIGNWRKSTDLPADPAQARATIRKYFEHLHRRGVRYVFPVHLNDNALGSTAVWNRLLVLSGAIGGGRFPEVADGSRYGVTWRLDRDPLASPLAKPVLDLLTHGRVGEYERRSRQVPGGHINRNGLTKNGLIAVEELMRLGMMIDIDHMGIKSRSETFAVTEPRRYPLISGHTHFFDLALDPPGRGAEVSASPGDWANDFRLRREEVERIRRMGGFVSPALNQNAVRAAAGSRVANDCDGSSKSFAQAYQHAVKSMSGAPVAFGSDVNGWARMPGPRFGTMACWHNQLDDARRGRRRDQVLKQRDGVRYSTPIREYRAHRFPWEGSNAAWNREQRDIWEGIAIFKAGKDPRRDALDIPGFPHRTVFQINKVKNIARGLLATGQPRDFDYGPIPADCPHERRAAFYVKNGRTPGPGDHAKVKVLYLKIKLIWDRWEAMSGGNAPLARSVAGARDFDINLDGVAHYGLIPDFIQDLKNVGLSEADLRPLMRSAQGFVEFWERVEARRAR